MSRALNVLAQVIALAKKVLPAAEKDATDSVQRLFAVVLGIDEQSWSMILAESGSQELYAECLRIRQAIATITHAADWRPEVVLPILQRIARLEEFPIAPVLAKQGLPIPVLKTIDPLIRRLVNDINKLSFVERTHYSCSGHFPYEFRAYIVIEYDLSSVTQANIAAFHNALGAIATNVRDSKEEQLELFKFPNELMHQEKEHTWIVSYYFHPPDHVVDYEASRQYLLTSWSKVERLVAKFRDNDSLAYQKQRSALKPELLDDDAMRIIYCANCGKAFYSTKKQCPSCGLDSRVTRMTR